VSVAASRHVTQSAGLRRAFGRRMDQFGHLLLAALITVVLAFLLLPLLMVTVMSFDAREYLGQFPPPALSMRWYERFFAEPYYLQGLKTSIALACLTMVISTSIGVSAAVGISMLPTRAQRILTTLFLSPLVIPGVVVGFALLIFYSRAHVDNTFLRLLGAHVLITFPYSIRTVLATLSGLRPSYVEAALSLGATERRAFWTVTVPLLKTSIGAGAVFAFVFSFDDVAASMFLSDPTAYTLPVALLSMMYANFDLVIAAASLLQIVMTVLLMLVLDAIVGMDRVVGTSVYKA
jgi:putative spermidine/putrescine transport system permease protein